MIRFKEVLMAQSLVQSELKNFPQLEWPEIAPKLNAEYRTALEQVMESLDGGVLSREQCLMLANAEGDDLLGLLVAANALRRELAGNIVTYVVNRNINFTNICFVGCKFCAFSRGPRESDTYFLTPEKLGRRLKKPGHSAQEKSAFKAGCRAISLLFTIAIFCAR
jgi:2-iminoacetate synthase ThiH